MMTLKRLTLTAVLICCLGASLANAQRLAALPNDSRFDTPITLTTALGGESLGAIITAIANSVGLTPVLEDVPDELVNYEIIDPKPFRQIWNLVLSLNGLDYQLLPNDIVVVGLTEAIGTVGERRFVAGQEIPVETRFYFTRFVAPEQIEERLNTLLGNIDTDDLLVLEDFLRATADANPQLQQAPAADGTDDVDGAQPAPQIFFAPTPAPAAEPAEPQGWQEDSSAPVVMLAGNAGMFFAQATDTTMQATAAEEPTLAEQLISIRVDNDVLVVTAPEGIIDQLERIITALDAPSQRPAAPDPIVRRSYQLSNARADQLAEVLRQALTGVAPVLEEDGVQQQVIQVDEDASDGSTFIIPTIPSQTEQPIEEEATLVGSEQVAISADIRTNRLIVTAPLSIQEEIEELLVELDIPQLQVSIQIRIQQVSTDVTSNLGLNISSGIGNLTANFVGDSGLNFVFDAQRALSGFNIGATLDALETQGLSRNVDDTTLTVLTNETANFNSGGRIEVILGSELIVTPFGTNISVTPRIGSNGRIALTLSAELSDLRTPITQRDPRVFDENRITSTVALNPGQTVLLGGLFQSSLTQSVTSVPILGSIPIVGELFRSRTYEEEDSELLLIVTADIIE
ncbi:MAG: secretin N-terminal domain-containing protein [Deinococcota bacterium]